jgi:hypothetical protein
MSVQIQILCIFIANAPYGGAIPKFVFGAPDATNATQSTHRKQGGGRLTSARPTSPNKVRTQAKAAVLATKHSIVELASRRFQPHANTLKCIFPL